MAMNPSVFQDGKVVNASAPLTIPQSFAAQTNATQSDGSASTDASSNSATRPAPTNGVESLLAPRYLMTLVAALAAFIIL